MSSDDSGKVELEILNLMEVALVRLDSNLNILWVNSKARQLLSPFSNNLEGYFEYYASQLGYTDFQTDVQKCKVTDAAVEAEALSSNLCYFHFRTEKLSRENILVSITDVSSERKRELELEASEALFKSFMSVSPILAWMKNDDYEYTYMNKAYREVLGIKKGAFKNKNDFSFFNTSSALEYRSSDQRVLMLGDSLVRKASIEGGSSKRTYLIYKFPFSDSYRTTFIGGLAIDITEQDRAEQKLKKLNIELEEKVLERTKELRDANEELESFNYSVSHDLKSPLRAIQSYSALLLEDHLDVDNASSGMLSNIKKSAEKMVELIDGLLSFSRLGSISLSLSEFDLDDMITETFSRLTGENRNDIQLINKGCGIIRADRVLFERVIENLMSNAIKYSSFREESMIEVGTKNGVFYLKDNGIGFDIEESKTIFGVFERAKTEGTFEGHGLGLAIVERIVKKHEGKVWAEAVVGEGATFFVRL